MQSCHVQKLLHAQCAHAKMMMKKGMYRGDELILKKQPKKLSAAFFADYGNLPELMTKPTRRYCIALLEIDDLTFAIPFRTHIHHRFSYIFTNSSRSDCSGLDFSKAVVLTKPCYIGADAMIDAAEYAEFLRKRATIARRFDRFLRDYKLWVKNPAAYHAELIVRFSTLQYFHKELGITS